MASSCRWLAAASLLLVLVGCKAGAGDPCKEDNDCEGSLMCCSPSGVTRGSCMQTCTGIGVDAGGMMDAAPDAAGGDAAADGAAGDASQDAGGNDGGADDGGPTDAGPDAGDGGDGGPVDAATDASADAMADV